MMLVLCTLFAGLAILPLLIYAKNPNFLLDLKFALGYTYRGSRISKYAKRRPVYTILDRFLDGVAAHPQKPFIVFEDSTYTYRDADEQSNRVARALQTHAGVKAGESVALFLGNEPLFVWTWLGVAKLGCTSALLNTNIRSKSLLHCFSCCDAKVLVAAADLQEAVEEVLPSLQEQGVHVFILSEKCDKEGIESLSDKIKQASDQPLSPQLRANLTFKSPMVYIFTSGTTGLPKAAAINHERVWKFSFSLSNVGGRSDDVVYICLPLYHTAGFLVGLCGAMEMGITAVLRRKFSVSCFWDDCRKHNVTIIQYIGETMRYLCNTPKRDGERDHRVRLALGNGIRGDTWVEFLQRFGNIHILEFYGSTEGNISFANYTGNIGAIGRENFLHKAFYPYALIRFDTEKEEPVRDSKGFCIEVPRGETGLLVAKIGKSSPFYGYVKNREQTEKKRMVDVFVKGDQYFNTGDLLKIDQEGFIYFQDRIGDTFRWKGENVATTEVADHLVMIDCIQEANVYGVKVPGHEGRIGMAAVTLKDGMEFDTNAMYQHVIDYLPSYARPYFIRVQSSLALTGTFKQMKVRLTEEGFDPAIVTDPLYYLQDREGYVPMTQDVFSLISEGKIKL